MDGLGEVGGRGWVRQGGRWVVGRQQLGCRRACMRVAARQEELWCRRGY